MKGDTLAAKVLVACDNAYDCAPVLRELASEIENPLSSTDPALAPKDFERCAPDILVLAFNGLARALRYCSAIGAVEASLPPNSHRTVILCNQGELSSVVDLCRQERFDDYVLYWPDNPDAPRLTMSIRIAFRELTAARAHTKRPGDLLARAKHVDELDRILDAEPSAAELEAGVIESIALLERDVASVVDDFSNRMTDKAAADWVEVKDHDVLARRISQLKQQQIALARRCGALGLESIQSGVRRLKDKLEPSLAGTRALAEELRRIRPLLMVVEDDEFTRQLVSRTLDSSSWQAIYAVDGKDALSRLKRVRPDVILMDVGLPGIDGLSLTQHLKSSPYLADIPVIIMTGDARRQMLINSVAVGAAAFVVKPFSRELLTAKLERALALATP